VPRDQLLLATVHLGDDEAQLNQNAAARTQYEFAIELTQQSANPKIQSLALAHLADVQEKLRDSAAAAQSYQRVLALDANSSDPQTEGLDWFNYGQFLRRHAIADNLAYACFLKAENLLQPFDDTNLATVQTMKHQLEEKMSRADVIQSRNNLATLLTQSLNLPSTSFP
jgi:hypothetical protein